MEEKDKNVDKKRTAEIKKPEEREERPTGAVMSLIDATYTKMQGIAIV